MLQMLRCPIIIATSGDVPSPGEKKKIDVYGCCGEDYYIGIFLGGDSTDGGGETREEDIDPEKLVEMKNFLKEKFNKKAKFYSGIHSS